MDPDSRIKSAEAAARDASSGRVGAVAVAQAAPGGRRQGPRVRRSASARRRARQRAGLEPADGGGGGGDPNSASGTSGGGGQPISEMEMVNPDSLIAADVEMDTYGMDMEEDYETLGFWQLDKADKFICAGICILVVALIVILGVGMSR
ncbi:hypothetical protein ACHAWT_005048 [Skeletonema menzelii]